MKLSTSDVTNLRSILATAALGKIEALIIEDGSVRGVDKDKTFVLVSSVNVPNLPVKAGISRLSDLRKRLEILDKDPQIEAKESGPEIRMFEISAGRTKIQYRCTSTSMIKAPKGINDIPSVALTIGAEELESMLKMIRVLGAQTFQFDISDSSVIVRGKDSANDNFTQELESKPEIIGTFEERVTYTYVAPPFIAAAKASAGTGGLLLIIGELGSITMKIDDRDVAILPLVDSGD